jgi:hypothetical protein
MHSTKAIRSSRITILGVSLVIPWKKQGGIPAGSCGSLLDDLIREKEKRMALL